MFNFLNKFKPTSNEPQLQVKYLSPITFNEDKNGIIIYGSVPEDAKRFNINLQTGPETHPNYTVGLHLSVRFDDQVFVRNSYLFGWLQEERQGGMPLVTGRQFIMVIVYKKINGKPYYLIRINGEDFCTYREIPEIPIHEIKYIQIVGDVHIVNVT